MGRDILAPNKVLHQVQTESHNTSGMVVGGGYPWMSDGHLYYFDAGFPVGSNVSNDPNSGWICRIDV